MKDFHINLILYQIKRDDIKLQINKMMIKNNMINIKLMKLK